MAAHMEPSAVGVFDDLEGAEKSIDDLRKAGFKPEEIGIIGHVSGDQQTVPTGVALKAPEKNATWGVTTGGIWGAIVGALVILVIPGLGLISGLGRWFEIVGGIAFGAAIGGTLFAASSFFFSRAKGRFFERELEKGRFIVTVSNPSRRGEAVSLLRRQGP